VFGLSDVYLDGKHIIQSCLDLVAIAIDGITGLVVQNLLRDSPRNHKMTHAVSVMSSAYWNWFDNIDGISDKYKLNTNGAKTLP
jgi:hypothetical protein